MSLKILIVDDEVPLLKNLQGYLSSLGDRFQVVTATNAEEGLAVLERDDDYDVLVTDVRLPGMDGIELVRSVKAKNPALPVVVMSAYGTAGLKRQARAEGALTFLEKPVDLEDFRAVLEEASAAGSGWSGTVGGLDIFDVTQLLAISGRSIAVRVTFGKRSGILMFQQGRLVHAATGELKGERAFFEMAHWSGGTFQQLPNPAPEDVTPNVEMPLTQLMMEAARWRDEKNRKNPPDESSTGERLSGGPIETAIPGTTPARSADPDQTKEEWLMGIKDHLQAFKDIDGFKAVAIFTAEGKMIESEVLGGYDIKTVGTYAHNTLLTAQQAADHEAVGPVNLVQIRTDKATILAHRINRATDIAPTRNGKAHFHTILVLAPEGNVGMAALILDKIANEIADGLS